MRYRLGNQQPELIGTGHFIAPNAALIGNVRLHDNVSVWFNVVVRADADVIDIGAGSNIQDGSVLHVDPGYPLQIGANVTVGHKVMLHGCSIGEGSLIGINAVVLNGAKIGKGCLIGAGAVVTEGMEIPDYSLVLGMPAKIVKTLDQNTRAGLLASAEHYVQNGCRFNEQLQRVD